MSRISTKIRLAKWVFHGISLLRNPMMEAHPKKRLLVTKEGIQPIVEEVDRREVRDFHLRKPEVILNGSQYHGPERDQEHRDQVLSGEWMFKERYVSWFLHAARSVISW